jgi:hypothetical protein
MTHNININVKQPSPDNSKVTDHRSSVNIRDLVVNKTNGSVTSGLASNDLKTSVTTKTLTANLTKNKLYQTPKFDTRLKVNFTGINEESLNFLGQVRELLINTNINDIFSRTLQAVRDFPDQVEAVSAIINTSRKNLIEESFAQDQFSRTVVYKRFNYSTLSKQGYFLEDYVELEPGYDTISEGLQDFIQVFPIKGVLDTAPVVLVVAKTNNRTLSSVAGSVSTVLVSNAVSRISTDSVFTGSSIVAAPNKSIISSTTQTTDNISSIQAIKSLLENTELVNIRSYQYSKPVTSLLFAQTSSNSFVYKEHFSSAQQHSLFEIKQLQDDYFLEDYVVGSPGYTAQLTLILSQGTL